MTADLAVEAIDLVKVFGGKQVVRALDGVSLEVATGTVLGLLGPNGAGKTTAVRILSTILSPDGGRASILGYDVVREAGTVRRIIGLAGQYATVDENLTGRENIKMVGRLSHLSRRVAAQRADELLEQFELTDAANRPLKTYSGGMRRRIDLAAALVAHPPVLFLDEPTTGLDPQSRQALWLVIEKLVAEGTTVLLTTQYLEEADRLAQQIVVVDHGQVIARGRPAELKADLGTTVISLDLADPTTALTAAGFLEGRWPHPPSVSGSSIEITVEDGPRAAAEILRSLDQIGLTVSGLALREPSLDDVFLALTGRRAELEPDSEDADRTTAEGPTAPGRAPATAGRDRRP